MAETRAILYGFWLSSCSWRVRAALRHKGIDFEERSVDIVKARAQMTEAYRAVNPSQKVPALVIVTSFPQSPLPISHHQDEVTAAVTSFVHSDNIKALNGFEKMMEDGETIVESMAILQYLEDTRPQPSLIPNTPMLRARMREICEIVVSGIQPLQNVGLRPLFETENQYINFTRHWTARGLEVLEVILAKTAGKYCIGDSLSQADLCFVPQVFNAVTRHRLDLVKYPTTSKLYEALLREQLFIDTHPNAVKKINKL